MTILFQFIVGALLGLGLNIITLNYHPRLSYLQLAQRIVRRVRNNHFFPYVTKRQALIWIIGYGLYLPLFLDQIAPYLITPLHSLTWFFISLILIPFIRIDCRFLIIPDSLPITLMLLGLLNYYFDTASLMDRVISALFAGIILWLPRYYYLARHHCEALGLGDIKLAFTMGLFLPITLIPYFILVAALIGIMIYLLIRLSTQSSHQIVIPFAPALLISFLIFLFIKFSSLHFFIE